MPDSFLGLHVDARRRALELAETKSGFAAHLLEKDIWVVWSLETLYASPFAGALSFKGGTSLSKAHKVIRRFSEDVDITYDIRALMPALAGKDEVELLPENKSQADRLTDKVRSALTAWLEGSVQPFIAKALADNGLEAEVALVGKENEKLLITYSPVLRGDGYVTSPVVLEFGARATGEPTQDLDVVCDMEGLVEGVSFPRARPHVLRAERTFWEKVTAMHVYCLKERWRGGERFARHWYDVARLGEVGIADRAINDRILAESVARHKAAFFIENDASGTRIDYHEAIKGKLRLVPPLAAAEVLEKDYSRMVEDGLFYEEAESFVGLMEKCRAIEERANSRGREWPDDGGGGGGTGSSKPNRSVRSDAKESTPTPDLLHSGSVPLPSTTRDAKRPRGRGGWAD